MYQCILESWDGGSCPIMEFYTWALDGGPHVYNHTAVDEWASKAASCSVEKGFDGILLDMEGIGEPPLGPEVMLDAIYTMLYVNCKKSLFHILHKVKFWNFLVKRIYPSQKQSDVNCFRSTANLL